MPKPISWSVDTDRNIIALRSAGLSWDFIAGKIGVSRSAAIDRGKEIGATSPLSVQRPSEDFRGPLKAGSSASWGAINEGLSIEGAPYPKHEHQMRLARPSLLKPLPPQTSTVISRDYCNSHRSWESAR